MSRLIVAALVPFAVGCATALPHPGPSVTRRELPVTIRVDAGNVWASHFSSTEPHVAWQVPAEGAVEGLDVQRIRSGYQVTLRQGGKRWKGLLDSHRRPVGPLTVLPASAPALATVTQP